MATTSLEDRCAMGLRAREYAQRVLSKEVNLNKVVNSIEGSVG